MKLVRIPVLLLLAAMLFVPAAFADASGAHIAVSGASELDWSCGVPWQDPGFSAFDADGTDRTGDVVTEGTVIPWHPGDYELRYVLGDTETPLAEAARCVHVRAQTLPETVRPVKGTICLTFDDGPCEYTGQVLETLAKYGIHAAFFIVANQTKYLDLLPVIVEQGHTLGLHCYDHRAYQWLYENEENYFSDLMTAQKIVYEQTGRYAHILRFPGGSRTASFLAGTLPGGYEELYGLLHDAGFHIYDWNVQPESAGKTTESTIVEFTHPTEPYEYAVVLQHDTRRFSVAALDRMIEWALREGYTFSALDETFPEVSFSVEPEY